MNPLANECRVLFKILSEESKDKYNVCALLLEYWKNKGFFFSFYLVVFQLYVLWGKN